MTNQQLALLLKRYEHVLTLAINECRDMLPVNTTTPLEPLDEVRVMLNCDIDSLEDEG